MKKIMIHSIILLSAFTCGAPGNNIISDTAPVIIYKTRADYTKNVPVRLNEARDRIVGYPDPGDLLQGNNYTYPIKLKKGYLLDIRGVGKTTAFTSFTYEEYSALTSAPSLEELYESIIDKEPFTELYLCGKRNSYGEDIVKKLNRQIKEGCSRCTNLLD